MARMTRERFDEAIEQDMRSFFATLSEKDRRRYAAFHARQLGFGGIQYGGEKRTRWPRGSNPPGPPSPFLLSCDL